MPSKELFSIVLGEEVKSFDPAPIIDENHNCKPMLMCIVMEDKIDLFGITRWYDIYELLNKCKEWVKSLGYCVSILDRPNELCTVTLSYGIDFDYSKSFSYKKDIDGGLPSDVGSIFLACQWVLDRQKLLRG